MEIKRYQAEYKAAWNIFVQESRNGTFLLERDFMDYHKDRFSDHSLMIYNDNVLLAVFPANENENLIYSHQGLTYGDLILSNRTSLSEVVEAISVICGYYKSLGIKEIIWKIIPYFYHRYPSQESVYVLFTRNATLFKRDIATIIDLNSRLEVTKGRKSQINRAKKQEYTIGQSFDFLNFMELEKKILEEKYQSKPTHTTDEILILAKNFPNQIKLFTCCIGAIIHAGIIVFETTNTVHCQYIATSEDGRKNGALDLLVTTLIQQYTGHKHYFEFGISTEDNGFFLNNGLHFNKESYGARSVVYDGYKLIL